MQSVTRKFILPLAMTVLALTLAACGGGGGNVERRVAMLVEPMPEGEIEPEPEMDAAETPVVRLERIVQQGDRLLGPSRHASYSLTVQGLPLSDQRFLPSSCSGTVCTAFDGTTLSIEDVLDESVTDEIALRSAAIASVHGFDTLAVTLEMHTPGAAGLVDDVTITEFPSLDGYGFWDDHGFAALAIADGPVAGRADGVPIAGEFSSATSFVLGDTTGSNPAGTGGASWSGPAEAASTSTFERRRGTATLTIADLSQPRLGVEIDVPGYAIGSPAWSDIPLHAGRFQAGTLGGGDYLEGDFYGPAHEEVYGVFDTRSYIGAFGGKQE